MSSFFKRFFVFFEGQKTQGHIARLRAVRIPLRLLFCRFRGLNSVFRFS